MKTPTCKKCNTPMKKGMAIQNKLTGLPDFGGDKSAVTLSRNGPPEMCDVWKCPSCGHSFENKEIKNKLLLTPAQWELVLGFAVLDPDGWDRSTQFTFKTDWLSH